MSARKIIASLNSIVGLIGAISLTLLKEIVDYRESVRKEKLLRRGLEFRLKRPELEYTPKDALKIGLWIK